MSLDFTAGQLVKMGKFKDAIPQFETELMLALEHGVIYNLEVVTLVTDFNSILLNPSNFDEVQGVGNKMLQMAMRIPGYLTKVSKEDFYTNVKMNYETIKTDD
jgi:hypothetical protein